MESWGDFQPADEQSFNSSDPHSFQVAVELYETAKKTGQFGSGQVDTGPMVYITFRSVNLYVLIPVVNYEMLKGARHQAEE